MSSPQTTEAELAAAAEAIRSHDRFLVTTHENPDGDALGSLLAAKLALEQLGKDAVMTLQDRKSTRLNSSHDQISYAVFCLKKKKLSFAQRNGWPSTTTSST